MPEYLLDTNHASPLVTQGHLLRDRVLREIDNGSTFAICVPVLVETVFGISGLQRSIKNLEEWKRIREDIPCYALDELDAELAADLRSTLRRRGWQIDTEDALIAAIALRYDLALLTTDHDFDAVPNLQRENWLLESRV